MVPWYDTDVDDTTYSTAITMRVNTTHRVCYTDDELGMKIVYVIEDYEDDLIVQFGNSLVTSILEWWMVLGVGLWMRGI
jgi:hypothetical protein